MKKVIDVPTLCGLDRLLVRPVIVSGPLLVPPPPLLLVLVDEPDPPSNNVNCCI